MDLKKQSQQMASPMYKPRPRYQKQRTYSRYEHIWKTEYRRDLKPSITIEQVFDYLQTREPTSKLAKFFESIITKSQTVIIPLVIQYMESKYCEFELRKSVQSQFEIEIKNFIDTQYYTQKHQYDIVVDYVKELDKFCFQGGYGYSVSYGSHTPHHWCLKPEYYQQMGKIPEDIQEILAIYGKDEVLIRIEPECLIESWGN